MIRSAKDIRNTGIHFEKFKTTVRQVLDKFVELVYEKAATCLNRTVKPSEEKDWVKLVGNRLLCNLFRTMSAKTYCGELRRNNGYSTIFKDAEKNVIVYSVNNVFAFRPVISIISLTGR